MVATTNEMTEPATDTEHTGDARRITLQRVADAAGVSIATASHAYNRPDRISPATRERVLATGRSLGYSGPNPAARALSRGVAGAVEVSGPAPLSDLFERPSAALFMAGLSASLAESGLTLSLTSGTEAAGAQIAFRHRDPPTGAWVVADSGPVPGAVHVAADIAAGARELAAHLAALGHRSLGIIGWEGEAVRAEALISAWAGVGPARLATAESLSRSAGEAAGRALLAIENRPSAVIAISEELALGVLDASRHLGIATPNALSVAGLDDTESARIHDLTTAFIPYRPMGELAGAAVLERLAGREPAPPMLFPCVLTIRGSTAPAPGG